VPRCQLASFLFQPGTTDQYMFALERRHEPDKAIIVNAFTYLERQLYEQPEDGKRRLDLSNACRYALGKCSTGKSTSTNVWNTAFPLVVSASGLLKDYKLFNEAIARLDDQLDPSIFGRLAGVLESVEFLTVKDS
jgi:hypothetical protein